MGLDSVGAILDAYDPLTVDRAMPSVNDPFIIDIAHKHGKTTSQIILRWLLQKGMTVTIKPTSFLDEYLNIFNFDLSNEEVELINSISLFSKNPANIAQENLKDLFKIEL